MNFKKILLIILIFLISFSVVIYVYCEIQLNLVANKNISGCFSKDELNIVDHRFNRALWIHYTDDQEMKLEKITLLKVLFKAISKKGIDPSSDTIVYLSAGRLIHENNTTEFKGIHWQIRWLSFSKWISSNWDVDECLSYLANKSYYGHGYKGISQAAKGFFQKKPNELSVDEISMLVAATIEPTTYNIKTPDAKLMKKTNQIKAKLLRSKNCM